MHAGKLADHLVSSKRDLSLHLSILHKADLIQETNKGGAITYRLDVTVLEETLISIMGLFKIYSKGIINEKQAE